MKNYFLLSSMKILNKLVERFAKNSNAPNPGGWTYVRFFHVRAVVDSRNSRLTLANVPIVPNPVAQHG